MLDWFLIGLGGGAGAVLRHAVGEWLAEAGRGVPWATLVVNVLGAAGLGVLLALLEGSTEGQRLRLVVGVGLLGGFTTFSTFSVEIVRLAQDGGWIRGAAYAVASVLLGVGGVLLGIWAVAAAQPAA